MYPEDELDWRETLLDILQKMDPSSFERLCQRLLRESGFIEVQGYRAFRRRRNRREWNYPDRGVDQLPSSVSMQALAE